MLNAEGHAEQTSFGCNCLKGPTTCPLQGECKTPSLVYGADVQVSNVTKHYDGQTARTFKTRWNIHKSDIKLGRRRTGLCSHVLDLQRDGVVPDDISWRKIVDVKPRSRGAKYCPLCITEKVFIARADQETSLNPRSEVMRKCRHKESLVLANFLSRGGPGEGELTVEENIDGGRMGETGVGLVGDEGEVVEEIEGGNEGRRTQEEEPNLDEGGLPDEEELPEPLHNRQLRSRGRKRQQYSQFF